MEPENISPSESIIQSIEMFNQLSVNEFVDLQMPKVSDILDMRIKGSMTKANGRLFEIFADKGKLELVPNQDIENTNPFDLKYQIRTEGS